MGPLDDLRRVVRDCKNEVRQQRGTTNLGKKLEDLENVRDLDRALLESSERPVLLFKHSLTCPISWRAFDELRSYLNNADPRVSFKVITVQTARAVSNETASRLELEHESPQAIIVRNGRERWNASHSDITASSLDQAIRNTS